MICPLMTAAYLVNKGPTEPPKGEVIQIIPIDTIACLEKDCAMWSVVNMRCSLGLKI
jgi:hypothetical protein